MRCLPLAVACAIVGSISAQTNFPPPPVPIGNPVTTAKALLGMALFWEEQLSSTDTVACGTCHMFAAGGTDPRTATAVNPGVDGVVGTADDLHGSPGVTAQQSERRYRPTAEFGYAAQVTSRRAPSVVNAAYQPALFYDGRASGQSFNDPETGALVLSLGAQLENLVAAPPLNPVEMGHPGRTWSDVVRKLDAARPLALASDVPARLQTFLAGRSYRQLFGAAFGTEQVTGARIVMAIATYIRTLNSDQAPYDYVRRGMMMLTPQEQEGLRLFQSTQNGAVACATCHGEFGANIAQTGPVAGALTTVATGYYGSPQQARLLFHNVGIRPIAEDRGRQAVTGLTTDAGKFRVASLRNVTLSAPYFHNGSMATLADVLAFYDRGGDYHTNQSPSLTPRNMTAADRDALIALLATLTDPRVATETAPFDRPRLGSENGGLPTRLGIGSAQTSGLRAQSAVPQPALVGTPDFTVLAGRLPRDSWTMLLWDTDGYAWAVGTMEFSVAMTANLQVVSVGPSIADPIANAVQSVRFGLPNAPALIGTSLYGQWMFTDPNGTMGLGTSDGFRFELR